ncbi:MAG: hypothetical protein Q9225_000411 [Loekoesia sp. 1 TL-2023]
MTTEDYAVPSAVIAKIGGNTQGNATMTAPAEGFAESGLAQIFGSNSVAPPATSPSSSTDGMAPTRTRRIIVAGATVGGAAFLGLTFALVWFFRRSLRRALIGDLNERLEIDGIGRHDSELPGNAVFWELPGTAPAELWSPTVSPQVEDEFKFETKSDRELGWRGETKYVGDSAQNVKEKRDQDKKTSRHTQVTCKELA